MIKNLSILIISVLVCFVNCLSQNCDIFEYTEYLDRVTTNATLPTYAAGQYIFGTNDGLPDGMGGTIPIQGAGVFFNFEDDMLLTEINAIFGVKNVVGLADSFQVLIYTSDTIDKLPVGSALYTQKFSVDSVLASTMTPVLSTLVLDQPVRINDHFCIAFNHDGMDDDLGMLANNFAAGDGNGEENSFTGTFENGSWGWISLPAAGFDAEPLIIPVFDPIPVSISFPTDTLEVNMGESLVLNPTVFSFLQSQIVYDWTMGTDLSAVNIQNPSASPSLSQDYELKVSLPNGCKDSSIVHVKVLEPDPSNINGLDAKNPFTISAAHQQLTINFLDPISQNPKFEILDLQGRIVTSTYEFLNKSTYKIPLDYNSNGTYILKLNVEGQTSARLIYIQ